MKGALEFWKFFALVMLGSALMGLYLIGPGLLLAYLTGWTWAILAWGIPALVVLITATGWRRDGDKR
jgi:hypothetical protein